MGRYKVVGACVTNIPTQTPQGRMYGTYYKDAILPDGVDADRIRHLLDGRLIEEIAPAAPATPPAPPGDGQAPDSGTTPATPIDAQADDVKKPARAAGKRK